MNRFTLHRAGCRFLILSSFLLLFLVLYICDDMTNQKNISSEEQVHRMQVLFSGYLLAFGLGLLTYFATGREHFKQPAWVK